jgi:poly(A) polymerase
MMKSHLNLVHGRYEVGKVRKYFSIRKMESPFLAALDVSAPLESQSDSLRRSSILIRVEEVASRWLDSEGEGSIPGKLLSFGSSILGVVTSESDLDAVMLIPSSISRETFFSSFVKMITDSAKDIGLQSIMAVPDAHVPVLKMVVDGLPLDILPCMAPLKRIKAFFESQAPSSGIYDFRLISINELDTPSVLALNGVRVGRTLVDSIRAGRVISTDELVVGGEARLKKFQVCLRVVKYWARQRGIYGNAIGFFGGVTWAILLVDVCLQNTHSAVNIDSCSESEILVKFFQALHEQVWGANKPVTLRPFTVSPPGSARGSPEDENEEKVDSLWDPSSSEADRRALMPVLTPVAPYMNSTFNVVQTTQRILTDEFRRAAEITKLSHWSIDSLCCSALLELEFLYPTRIVLSIKASEQSAEGKKWLFVWESLVGSKLRVLLFHLERVPGLICRPFPDAVPGESEFEVEFKIFMAIVPVNGQEKRVIDFNDSFAQFHGALVAAMEIRDDQEDLRRSCKLSVRLVSSSL